MDKKTILALVLSALVLFAWQAYMGQYQLETEVPGPFNVATGGQAVETRALLPGGDSLLAETPRQETHSAPIEEVEIETEKYLVTLSNEGGCIRSIALKEYPQPVTGGAFNLIDITDPSEGIFAMDGLGGYDTSKTRFTIDRKDSEVVFSTRLENGVDVTKRYIFHNSLYHMDLKVHFYNTSNRPFQTGYSIVAGSNIDIAGKIDRRYAQAVSDVSGKIKRDNGGKGAGLFTSGMVKYTGLQNKYFSVLAKTSIPTVGAVSRQTPNNNLFTSIEVDKFVVNPSSSASQNFLLYAGPSKTEIMREYELDSAVSYGFFGGISKALLAGLKLFHRVFRNWGVAVLLLSVCVNLLLFPLSRKSYESMKKVQELQPHMERLRSEHKDNPQKLNKETMELYRKYNVNPMGGCLPLLLQMPIFIALYQALMHSLELRGAQFLWIRDLSMPDAVRLPFTMPIVGNTVNILPILMAGAMILQQKISTRAGASGSEQQKQQQQMMMIMMPVIFLFIMYSFPAGLVIYWLTNTILTMFEQRAIMNK